MSQNWVPPDIAQICPEANAPLTQCSQLGFMYLTLLTQLFGRSIDSVPKNPYFDYSSEVQNGYTGFENSAEEPFHSFQASNSDQSQNPFINNEQSGYYEHSGIHNDPSFHGPTSTSYSSIISHPYRGSKAPLNQYQIPLDPKPIKPHSPQFATGLTPVFRTDFSINHNAKTHSHSPKGTRFPDASFYSKQEFGTPDQSKLQKEFERPRDFKFGSSFGKYESPAFDFESIRRGFDDIDAAVSDTKIEEKTSESEKKNKKSRKKRQAIEEYDFIVVGAGSAGCVVANRLSEVKKWKVLLLEAGPEEPEVTSVPALAPVLGSSSIDWNYQTQPEELTCRAQRGQTCTWFRGKTMGGSSAINYLIYMRGNRRDYDAWAELGNPGWSYREVLPYFKKAENNQDIEARDKYYHSTGGPLNVERFPYIDINTMMIVQAFKEKGLPVTDFNGENQLGTDIAQSTSKNGRRHSANAAYIRPIRYHRPNLKVTTKAFTTKILIDPITKTAFGVQYVKDGVYHQAHAKKEVIVSAGTLNSPKLLLLSGIGPKEHLRSFNIPVLSDISVGHNLQDHITTDALILSLSNKTSTMVQGNQLMDEIYNYHAQHDKKTGPLTASGTLCGTAFIKTRYAESHAPDIQFHFDGRNVKEFYSDPTTAIATNIFPLAFYDGLAVRPLLLTPKSRGYILLNNTDPVFGQPLIYSRFFTDREDLEVLLEGMKYALSLEYTDAFQQSGAHFVKVPVQACAEYHWGTDEYFICLLTKYTSTIFHPVGTCKMGPKWEHDAVVDPRLRVYGIKSLRVIDASIMPLIVRGNTNAPTIMIGEKGSDFIKEDWLN